MRKIDWKDGSLWLYRIGLTAYFTLGPILLWGCGWGESILLMCVNLILSTIILPDSITLQRQPSYVKLVCGAVVTFLFTAIAFFPIQTRMEKYVYVMGLLYIVPLYAVYTISGAWVCLLIAKHSKPKPPVWRGNGYVTLDSTEKKGLSINVTDKKLWLYRLLCWVELIAYPVVIRCVTGEISFYGIWLYLILSIYFLKDRESPYQPQTWTNLYRAAWIVYAIIAVIQYCLPTSGEGDNIASSHLLITLPIYMLYSWIIMTQMQIHFIKKRPKT
ncbi:MAG: hypothetical protein K2J63_02395 [Muribaculaceae bacterium]|nr:hypothetical protein [Muribaculaceae bacterium]